MNNIDLNNNYLYVNSDGQVAQEAKKSGISSIISSLKRSFYTLTGLRDYNLGAVWRTIQDPNQKQLVANKALSSWSFSSTEQGKIKNILSGNKIDLNPDNITENISLNKKLFNPKIQKVFESYNKLTELKLLQKLTYKLSTTKATDFTEVDIKNSYKIDKMSDLYQMVNDNNSKIDVKSNALIESCKKADELKKSYLSNLKPADINIYDINKIVTTKIWSYTSFENLYFDLSRTKVSHVACEYLDSSYNIKTSHMMEDYENKHIALHQSFMSRFNLDLEKLVSQEVKNAYDKKNPNGDYKLYLRNSFNQVTRAHIEDNNEKLKKAKNPLILQVFSPIISTLKNISSLFTSTHSKYSGEMLCSEYAQVSLKMRLTEWNEKLKKDLNISQDVVKLPSTVPKHDFTLPQVFLNNWKDYLIPVENKQS